MAWRNSTARIFTSTPIRGKAGIPIGARLVFNYGRTEVRNFLLSSALFWMDKYHIDGLRVDAVASMLYLDYSRKAGEWIPNEFGGRENLAAISFLKRLNEVVNGRYPGVADGRRGIDGLAGGFPADLSGRAGIHLQMEHGLDERYARYFELDPIHRKYHHSRMTFSMLYAFTENFVLPLSHDEVVHGKRRILNKMPGDLWQQFANLRLLYAYICASRQEAALHGQRVRAALANGISSSNSSGICCNFPSIADCSGWLAI